MKELYESLGFKENPFSRFSAEEELEYLNDIFSPPKYYSTIFTDIKSGLSRFIVGERGIGKSALMFKLIENFQDENMFSILIDAYDVVPLKENNKELLLLAIRKLVTELAVTLTKNKNIIKKLDKEEKEKLAFFIMCFFESLSKTEYERLYDKATKIKTKNIIKRIFNCILLKPANIILSGVSEYASTTISKSLGLNYNFNADFYKAYIPEIPVEEIKKNTIEVRKLEYSRLKELLKQLTVIIMKCGFKNVVVFYDKIDEYTNLKGNISNITEFIKSIAIDTNLLHLNNISFVFVIWSKVKNELNSSGVRFDKFKPIDVNWTNDELKNIIDRRLEYFSDNKIKLEDILPNESYIDVILNLAYRSPRHLIMLLSRIYDEQAIIDSNVKQFNPDAAKKGILNFIKNFDYPSLYPGKATRKDYIITVINKILKVKKVEFEVKDWTAVFKISNQKTSAEIKVLREYGLIVEIDNIGSTTKKYKVIEPRLQYLIKNDITKIGEAIVEELDLESEIVTDSAEEQVLI